MLVHLFDVYRHDRAVGTDDVDGSVGITQTNCSVTLPGASQAVVSKAGDRPGRFQALELHKVDPESEVPDNVRRNLGDLLPSRPGELDLHVKVYP